MSYTLAISSAVLLTVTVIAMAMAKIIKHHLSVRRVRRYDRQRVVVMKQRLMPVVSGLWRDQLGQDIAEYSVMLAVILVIVVGTVRLIGSSSVHVFSTVSSSLQ
jgi:Flp pilus assembly pilin Flp